MAHDPRKRENCLNLTLMRLCLEMPVVRLCLDYDSEMKPVCGQSPRDMGSQAELGNQNSSYFRVTISTRSAVLR